MKIIFFTSPQGVGIKMMFADFQTPKSTAYQQHFVHAGLSRRPNPVHTCSSSELYRAGGAPAQFPNTVPVELYWGGLLSPGQ